MHIFGQTVLKKKSTNTKIEWNCIANSSLLFVLFITKPILSAAINLQNRSFKNETAGLEYWYYSLLKFAMQL